MKAINKCGPECIQLAFGLTVEDVKLLNQLSETAHLTDPAYAEGDNSNRQRGFLHNPYHRIAGRFFQFEIKGLIRKSLDTIEWWIEHKYDKDAFIYDDGRLQRLDTFTAAFIEERFQHAAYKLRIMHQIRHIVLFMAKEDPFYICTLIDFINRFVVEFEDGFELTESERYQLDRWHTGTTEEIATRPQDPIAKQPWMKRG